jgi:hypothetical protein
MHGVCNRIAISCLGFVIVHNVLEGWGGMGGRERGHICATGGFSDLIHSSVNVDSVQKVEYGRWDTVWAKIRGLRCDSWEFTINRGTRSRWILERWWFIARIFVVSISVVRYFRKVVVFVMECNTSC